MLYKQLIQTVSVLLLLQHSSMLGFPLYEDTANGRAATHQLYSFAVEIGLGANGKNNKKDKNNLSSVYKLCTVTSNVALLTSKKFQNLI